MVWANTSMRAKETAAATPPKTPVMAASAVYWAPKFSAYVTLHPAPMSGNAHPVVVAKPGLVYMLLRGAPAAPRRKVARTASACSTPTQINAKQCPTLSCRTLVLEASSRSLSPRPPPFNAALARVLLVPGLLRPSRPASKLLLDTGVWGVCRP